LTACSNAKTSSEINAAYVPSGKYERMSCKDLRAEERSANNTLTERTSEIKKHTEMIKPQKLSDGFYLHQHFY